MTNIIDSHQHPFWLGRDDKYLVADMDAHGIEQAWLLTWEIEPGEHRPEYLSQLNPVHRRPDGTHAGIPLSDVVLVRDRYPGRFVAGYCPHPLRGDAPILLRAAVAMHNVRVCGEWKFRLPFDDPRCLELYRVAGELNLPVILHLDVPYLKNDAGRLVYQPNWYGGTLDNLARALVACPETIFVGHAPGFWREISGDAVDEPSMSSTSRSRGHGRLWKLLDEHPNVWADLSAGSARNALQRDPKNAVEFLNRYCDRLLFGRDQYGQDLYTFLKTLNLPADVQEKINNRNAQRLLGIEQTL